MNFTTAAGGDVFRCWRVFAVSTGGSNCGRGGGGGDKRGRGGFWQEGRKEGRAVSIRTEIQRPQSDDLKVHERPSPKGETEAEGDFPRLSLKPPIHSHTPFGIKEGGGRE